MRADTTPLRAETDEIPCPQSDRRVVIMAKVGLGLGLFVMVCTGVMVTSAEAELPGEPAVASSQVGESRDKNGDPTFNIAPDGTVDWYSYEGYVRYTANCMQCHGPDGLGSSLAPSLADALKRIDYSTFVSTVANGKKDVSAAQDLVMPTLEPIPM